MAFDTSLGLFALVWALLCAVASAVVVDTLLKASASCPGPEDAVHGTAQESFGKARPDPMVMGQLRYRLADNETVRGIHPAHDDMSLNPFGGGARSLAEDGSR